MNPQRVAIKLQAISKEDLEVQVADSNQSQKAAPRTKIDRHAVAEFSAWAHALHVTEQELADALDKVGDDARDVIVHLLTRANCHAFSAQDNSAKVIPVLAHGNATWPPKVGL